MEKLNQIDEKLLHDILLNVIKNGNTVNPEAFIPDPKQYKSVYNIINKL